MQSINDRVKLAEAHDTCCWAAILRDFVDASDQMLVRKRLGYKLGFDKGEHVRESHFRGLFSIGGQESSGHTKIL